MIKDVTDLEIYKVALDLLPKLYNLLNKLPPSERFLSSQGKRSGASISANIAEGFAKRIFNLEFKRYLLISLASCDELISHLRTIILIQPDLTDQASQLIAEYKILAKRINRTRTVWHFKGISPSDLI